MFRDIALDKSGKFLHAHERNSLGLIFWKQAVGCILLIICIVHCLPASLWDPRLPLYYVHYQELYYHIVYFPLHLKEQGHTTIPEAS